MATYYVSKTGGDGGVGSLADPWLTIAFALTQCASTDTLRVVGPGTWTEGSLTAVLAVLSVIGTDSANKAPDDAGYDVDDRPIIDATGNNWAMYPTGVWTIQGLEATNGTTGGVYSNGGALTALDLYVHDCGSDRAHTGISIVDNNSVLRRCVVEDQRGYGIRASAATGVTIESCLAVRSTVRGIYNNGAGSLTEQCTVHDAGDTGAAIWGTTVRNCIAVDSTGDWGIRATTYDNCCSYSSNPAVYHTTANFNAAPDAESIELDPLFADPGGDDYHIASGSPCAATGAVASTALRDLDRLPFAAVPAMGCYEVVTAAVVGAPGGGPATNYPGAGGHYIQHWCGHRLPSVRSIQLNEGGGLVEILSEDTYIFEDLIEEWQQLANAGPGGLLLTYAFSYDSDAHTVTLEADGAFAYTLDDDVGALLGMASTGTGRPVYTSTSTPLGFCYPWAVEISQGRELTDEDIRQYRHGRSTAYITYRGRVRELRVRLNREHLEDLQAGPLFQGALRAYDGNEVLDLYPLEHREVVALGDVEYFADVVITCIEAESEPFQTSGVGREDHHSASLWRWGQLASGFPFGFGVTFLAQVDGIDVMFVEKGFGGSFSTHTIDESLIIDDSASIGSIVEREGDSGGIGRGFDLLLRLQDTTNVRALFQAPAARTKLTVDYDYAAGWPATVTVAATADFAASGLIHTGTTAIEYSAKPTGTTFTVDSATRYNIYRPDLTVSDHMCDVTSGPQFWRGRRVRLYAIGVTGFGSVEWAGSDIFDSAVEVWTGYVAEAPIHNADNTWGLQCRSLDRRLDDSIVSAASGTILFSFGEEAKFVVDDPNLAIRCIVGADGPGAGPFIGQVLPNVWPPGSAIGDQVYASAVRDQLSADWATHWATVAGLPAEFPTIGELMWHPVQISNNDGSTSMQWDATFNVTAVSDSTAMTWLSMYMHIGGLAGLKTTGMWSGQGVFISPHIMFDTGESLECGPILRMSTGLEVGTLRCVLDSGDPSEIPASGWVILEAEGITEMRQYDLVEDDTDHGGGGEVHLSLANANTSHMLKLMESFTAGQVLEVSCTFALGASGTVPDLMRQLLESSGRGNNGTYDVWDLGYDLNAAEIDEDSFDDVLGPSYKGMSADLIIDTDHSFTRLWSGLLTLSGHAIVPRRYDGLGGSAVNVGAPDTGYAAWSVSETELAAPLGGGKPIRPVQAKSNPNKIVTHLHRITSSSDDGSIEQRSPTSILATGPVTWDPHLYGFFRSNVLAAVAAWSHALFSAGATAQVVELDVQPWIEAEVGDQVYVNLPDAYQLWQWSSGQPGYVGNARVLGEQVNLVTGIRTLTVQLDGIMSVGALSPSAPIDSWDAALSTATTWIKVPLRYYEVFASFLRDDAFFWLIAYLPSEDVATTQEFKITATAVDGAACKLTVGDNTGVFTVTAAWFLTIPNVSEGTDAQDVYAHNTTDGVWG